MNRNIRLFQYTYVPHTQKLFISMSFTTFSSHFFFLLFCFLDQTQSNLQPGNSLHLFKQHNLWNKLEWKAASTQVARGDEQHVGDAQCGAELGAKAQTDADLARQSSRMLCSQRLTNYPKTRKFVNERFEINLKSPLNPMFLT